MNQFYRPRKPEPCFCCKKPLTEKRVVDPDRGVTIESWECTDPACISYRQRHAKIPDPPKSK